MKNRKKTLELTRSLIHRIGLAPRKRRMARETPQARGAHGQHHAQVAATIGIEEDQHGRAAARRELVPEGKGRRRVGAETGDGGLCGGEEGEEACQLGPVEGGNHGLFWALWRGREKGRGFGEERVKGLIGIAVTSGGS